MIKHIYIFVLAMMLLASSGAAKAQDVALKTNLLGWATTSLNAGVEVGIAEKQTAQLFATLNPWEFSGGKKVRIWSRNTAGGHASASEAASSECMLLPANTTSRTWTFRSASCPRRRADDTMKDGI